MNNQLSRNIILVDIPQRRSDLLPLSYTRPVADFRIGITTIREKWEALLPGHYSYLTVDYLAPRYGVCPEIDSLFVAGNVIPSEEIVEAVVALTPGKALYIKDEFVAYKGEIDAFRALFIDAKAAGPENEDRITRDIPCDALHYIYDVFLLNGKVLEDDYRRLTAGRQSQPLSPTNTLIGPAVRPDGLPSVFIEEGASVEGAVINVKEGPVYVGRDAEIMEGACIRGALALLDHSRINMGAKIYGPTTIGPICKMGGEINNCVIFGYSNKAHDGFIGNAVIGEWCNIGAGTNASNLKNDYTKIRLWNYPRRSFLRTDLQFCGLIMGDHSKIGVNCMLNTATVLGVGVNLHGSGFPRNFVPSFSEGSPTSGFTDVSLSKFFDIAARVMARRDIRLSENDKAMFERIFAQAEQYK